MFLTVLVQILIWHYWWKCLLMWPSYRFVDVKQQQKIVILHCLFNTTESDTRQHGQSLDQHRTNDNPISQWCLLIHPCSMQATIICLRRAARYGIYVTRNLMITQRSPDDDPVLVWCWASIEGSCFTPWSHNKRKAALLGITLFLREWNKSQLYQKDK